MAKLGKQISNPGLWRRIVREVRDQKVADTEEGKISATKIEVVEERYKRRGGEFKTPKKFVSKEKSMSTKISRKLAQIKRAETRKKKTGK